MSFQSWFTEEPKRQWVSGLGAEGGGWRIKPTSLLDDDGDARPAAFQEAWKSGASPKELFSNTVSKLHGVVGPSGADNHRPDVAKIQSLLGRTGHLQLPE